MAAPRCARPSLLGIGAPGLVRVCVNRIGKDRGSDGTDKRYSLFNNGCGFRRSELRPKSEGLARALKGGSACLPRATRLRPPGSNSLQVGHISLGRATYMVVDPDVPASVTRIVCAIWVPVKSVRYQLLSTKVGSSASSSPFEDSGHCICSFRIFQTRQILAVPGDDKVKARKRPLGVWPGLHNALITNVPVTVIPQPLVVAVAPVASVAVAVKGNGPTAVGVPVIAPVEGFRLRPGGRPPLAMANV